MAAATLAAKDQIVILGKIRARHGLTPGTQVEFIDEGGTIRLVVHRHITPSDPAAGYGLVKVKRSGKPRRLPRRLSDFDAASLTGRDGSSSSRTPFLYRSP